MENGTMESYVKILGKFPFQLTLDCHKKLLNLTEFNGYYKCRMVFIKFSTLNFIENWEH